MQHELIKIKYQLNFFFHCFQKQHLINKPDSQASPVESPSCHNGFPLDLDDHKNKRSRHQSFLYGCDRSLGVHVIKLEIEISNLKQNDWSTK